MEQRQISLMITSNPLKGQVIMTQDPATVLVVEVSVSEFSFESTIVRSRYKPDSGAFTMNHIFVFPVRSKELPM